MHAEQGRRLAVITGASSGIGFGLAKVFAENSYDLIPDSKKAEMHRQMAETGSAKES